MFFSLVTDTSANLPSPTLTRLHIPVVPFSYCVNGEALTCLDTEAFDGAAFYSAIRKGARVSTAQINPQAYCDCIEPLLRQGKDVLYVGMSSGISGSFRSAEMAAAELKERYPDRRLALFDTRAASLGEGLMVLEAARLRDLGFSVDEALTRLAVMRERTYQVFTVDDLMHLRRTGRLANALAIVGTVLQIKPILKGNELGQIVAFAKVRGRQRSIAALAERYDALAVEPEKQTVCIAHADAPEDAAALIALLRRNHPPKEILTVVYEPVTGSHVGPGTVALFFEGGSDVRSK